MQWPLATTLLLCALLAALPGPALASVSVVDLLSSQEDFTTLVRVLQRTGLIPVLNMARNITFFAPTNDVLESLPPGLDLATLLRYLIVTDPIVSVDMTEKEAVYFSYLRAPAAPDVPLPLKVERVPSVGNEPSDGSGMRLQIGSGAANVTRHDWIADNGVVQVVDSLVPLPDTLCSSVSWAAEQDDIDIFANLFLKHPMICWLLQEAQDTATLLAPLNSAFSLLNDVELLYLQSRAGRDDRLRFLGVHFLYSSVYRQNDTLGTGIKVPSMSGDLVTLQKTDDGILFNGAVETVDSDILFQDGVIHILPSLLTPWSFFDFTPLKYIYGLEASKFADELRFHGYGPVLSDMARKQVVFVPVNQDKSDLPATQNSLEYHFVDGDFQGFDSHPVLKSRLSLPSLNNFNQHIGISIDDSGEVYVNGECKVTQPLLHIGETVIVPIDRPLSLPPSARLAIGAIMDAHVTFELFESLGMFEETRMKGWTLFVPTDSAWKELGSVAKFVSSSPDILAELLYTLMITEPVYSSSFTDKESTYETVDGASISVSARGNLSELAFGGDYLDATVPLVSSDILFDCGVAHVISTIPMPSFVVVTPRDLLATEKVTSFVALLEAASMADSVLADDAQLIILAPADFVVSIANITAESLNLADQLGLHVLKRRNMHVGTFLSGVGVFDTLVPGVHVSVSSSLADDTYLLRIVNHPTVESIQPIRVLAGGRTSSGSEIYVVDRVLPASVLIPKPDSWWHAHGVLVALGAAAGIIGLSVVCLFWFWIIYRDGGRRRRRGSDKSVVRFRRSFSGSGRSIIIGNDEDGIEEEEEDEDAIGEHSPFLPRAASGRLGSRVARDDVCADVDEDAEEVELPARSSPTAPVI